MPVHTLANSKMSYGIYGVNIPVPLLSAPGLMTIEQIDDLGGGLETKFKKIWGVQEVFKHQEFEIEQTRYINSEIASSIEQRETWDIKFLPFLFNSSTDVVDNGQLYYGINSYNSLMRHLLYKSFFLYGDNAGQFNYINPLFCKAAELISVSTEKDDNGNRIVTANFQQKFLQNTEY